MSEESFVRYSTKQNKAFRLSPEDPEAKQKGIQQPSLQLSICSTYHLASPVLGIWIKNEVGFICETKIEYKQKGHDGEDGQPL